MKKIIKTVMFLYIVLLARDGFTQQIDFETIGRGKPFKVSGNIAANTVYYNSNQNASRAPFTYFLQGSLNFNIYEFSIPLSYSYSNQGDNLEYQLPFNFNRLSLHPKYRWIQTHIGDVNMNFSPYTLAGHQFTGGGLELTPKGDITFSAMTGRLLKATEDNDDENTVPAFKRMGYGAKIGYKKERYDVELIGFYAKDEINSISIIPEEKQVVPKENLVLSMLGSVMLIDGLRFKGEYASTAITQDLRAEESENKSGVASYLFNNRGSTEYYEAFKTELNYSFNNYSFGVGYERIDPGYQTLGAYFFNNDFENITLNGNTSIFKDKLNLSFNIGYQRDNLEDQKDTNTNRTVGSVNASYALSKKVNLSGSYSNFTTFTNNRIDQFETINDDNLLDNQDQLFDFKQLSQNANVNMSYILENSKDRRQNLNTNYSLAVVANEEDGVVRIGGGSTFHNLNSSYAVQLPKKKLNITTALNTTYNTIGRENSYTWGPTVSVNKRFFKDKLNTTLSSSYNHNKSSESSLSNTNIRANANYVYKEKHNFNLNAIQLFRNSTSRNTQDLTITFGYNYAFDVSKKKKSVRERKSIEDSNFNDNSTSKTKKKYRKFRFIYKGYEFSGDPKDITSKIKDIAKEDRFKEVKTLKKTNTDLKALEKEMIAAESQSKGKYKKKVTAYLEYLHKNQNYLDTYYNLTYKGLKTLYNDAKRMENTVERKYHKARSIYESRRDEKGKKFLEKNELAYKANIFVLEQLKGIEYKDLKSTSGILHDFKMAYLDGLFEMLDEGKSRNDVIIFLEIALAKTYHKYSRNKVLDD